MSLEKLKIYLLSCDDCEKEVEIKTIYKIFDLPKGWLKITFSIGPYFRHYKYNRYRCEDCVIKFGNALPLDILDARNIEVKKY